MTPSWLQSPASTVVLVRLALRNLRRQLRRSILTGLAIVLGVGLLVMSRAFAAGGHEDWIEVGVRLGSGHVTVQADEFQARQTLDERLSAAEVTAARGAIEQIGSTALQTVVRLEAKGLASSASAAVPVSIVGVDPSAERGFSPLPGRLVDGEYLASDDELAAFVGVRLAERLALELGSRLVLTAQDAEGSIVGQLVRVRGLFETGLPEVDERFVQIHIETARGWLVAPGSATTIAVLLSSSREVARAVETLSTGLIDHPGVRALSWPEAMPQLEAAVRGDDFGDWVFHIITLLIVALAVVNTILMSVLQRTREFGVVQALGMTRRQMGTQVLIEGVLLSAIGGIVGIALGYSVTWFFFRDGLDFSSLMEDGFRTAGIIIEPIVRPRFHLDQVLTSLGLVFSLGVLASVYPAYRASRIDVTDAMKFEA